MLAVAMALAPTPSRAQSLTILDVPYIAQSELLCGGAAAAMVLRYWGERGVDAESFQPLVDAKAGGIRTDALTADLRSRHWNAVAVQGSPETLARELQQGRPVITLIEDRPSIYHYVVVVARSAEGVVFHDPARSPFRVATATEFDRRWTVANRWMLVVTPEARPTPIEPPAPALTAATPCEQQIEAGVRQAQQNDLEGAERTLASAIACPGGGAFRELAGIRVVQGRWTEAADLASAALARDPSDQYALKLLATARFVSDDILGSLDAWNQTGEPRIDLIRIDGLSRTRYQVVEHAMGLHTGDTLTRGALVRARRRVSAVPALAGAVDFAPLPGGLAEVRARVAERPLVPSGAFDLGVLALATSVTREAAVAVSSPTGGGELIAFDWRFWAHRPLYRVSIAAPAPWRGNWGLSAARERQPFSAVFAPIVHDTLELNTADWATGIVQWQAGVGVDRWNEARAFTSATAGVRVLSAGDRLDARAQMRGWFGEGRGFQRGELRVIARSSAALDGMVIVADGGVASVSSAAPADMWVAGDTGRARPLLLRAHPLLKEEEQFRTERLGRLFLHQSTEMQRWWRIGPFRGGAATFMDIGRTMRRVTENAVTDVDIGIGLRGAYPGHAGSLRLDFAHGLRDGNDAVSVIYTSAIP